MTIKLLKIIGINPGTRYLGISAFEDPELMDWRIKALKGRWSKEKMEKVIRIISDLIERYEPNALSIKKLHPSRSSQNLKQLVAKIEEFSKREGLRVYEYSIKELENFFNPEEKLNKKNLAEAVASYHPVLLHEFNKEKSHKNPYYTRMFEAVALASACFYKLDR